MVHQDNIFDDHICYTKKLGVPKILQLSQHYATLTPPGQRQGNYSVISIYGIVYGCTNKINENLIAYRRNVSEADMNVTQI